MARPTKRTAERQTLICRAIEIGATYVHAAAAAGITYETLNEWRKSDPAFSDALKAAEARGVLACLARIQTAAKEGQWQAAAWILERRYPNEYGRRERVDMRHEGTLDITMLANMRAAILSAVGDDVAARTRIADALAALDAPADEGGANGRGA